MPGSLKDSEIEALQESKVLLDAATVGASRSDYHPIHGYRTPKEVMVYARFLASRRS